MEFKNRIKHAVVLSNPKPHLPDGYWPVTVHHCYSPSFRHSNQIPPNKMSYLSCLTEKYVTLQKLDTLEMLPLIIWLIKSLKTAKTSIWLVSSCIRQIGQKSSQLRTWKCEKKNKKKLFFFGGGGHFPNKTSCQASAFLWYNLALFISWWIIYLLLLISRSQ